MKHLFYPLWPGRCSPPANPFGYPHLQSLETKSNPGLAKRHLFLVCFRKAERGPEPNCLSVKSHSTRASRQTEPGQCSYWIQGLGGKAEPRWWLLERAPACRLWPLPQLIHSGFIHLPVQRVMETGGEQNCALTCSVFQCLPVILMHAIKHQRREGRKVRRGGLWPLAIPAGVGE